MRDTSLLERLRAGYSRWNETGDITELLSELDPDIEIVLPDRAPEGAFAFRGHEGAAQWAQGMGDVWQDLRFEPVEIESDESGRRALVIVRVTTTGRSSEVALQGTEAHVVSLGPEGRVTRIEGFTDVERARAVFEAG